jgi:hypothetical protein
MKVGLIAQLVAVDTLRRAGFRPGGNVYLESVSGEETGQYALTCRRRTLAPSTRSVRRRAALTLVPSLIFPG